MEVMEDGSSGMLRDIHAKIAARCSAINAALLMCVVTNAGNDLTYAATWLCNAITSGDTRKALFAFDVLDMQCGGAGSLPASPVLHSDPPAIPIDLATSSSMVPEDAHVRRLVYDEKVMLAADLVGSVGRLDFEVDNALASLSSDLLRRAVCLLYVPSKISV